MKEITVNNNSFAGEIIGITKEEENLLVILNQKVQGVFNTAVALFIKKDLVKSFLKEFNPKQGETLLIINSYLYEKNDIIRMKVDSLDQVIKKQSSLLNNFNLTGEVTGIVEEETGGKTLFIYQKVGGTIPTKYEISVSKQIVSTQKGVQDLQVHDSIYVTNGVLYTKDGSVKIRVSHPSDIMQVPKCYNLGECSAKEKFI